MCPREVRDRDGGVFSQKSLVEHSDISIGIIGK
jgi:hypothetical protein